VPSRGVERWVSQQLALSLGAVGAQDGVAANIEFPSPAQLIGEVLACAVNLTADEDPWVGPRLVWGLLEVIDSSAAEPWSAVLDHHLGRDGAAPELRAGRRYATAALLARHCHDPRRLGQSPISDLRAATSIVNTASALSSMWPELRGGDDSFTRCDAWASESSADAATSAIARETIELVTSPQWQQLRPCTAPGCAYYFVKQHFRQRWCSAVCGNRARVARHAAQLHHKT
jgi:hypothetical protein